MSAYINQLDILGFDGGAAAWTNKINASMILVGPSVTGWRK